MKIIISILALICCLSSFSQKKTETINEESAIKVVAAPESNKSDDIDIEEEIPFSIIEIIPVFPGCEEVPEIERSFCFQQQITKHIQKYTTYTEEMRNLNLQGKVNIKFIINKEGFVEQIKTMGKNTILEAEALRVIKLLPKMKPGTQRGAPVKVSYVVPISFKLN